MSWYSSLSCKPSGFIRSRLMLAYLREFFWIYAQNFAWNDAYEELGIVFCGSSGF